MNCSAVSSRVIALPLVLHPYELTWEYWARGVAILEWRLLIIGIEINLKTCVRIAYSVIF